MPATRLLTRPLKRQHAERYVLLMLLAFAVSVVGTRLFLELTGYPQIGGGALHIAHVLWGGLLLFAASLLPLVWLNGWVYPLAGILSGFGVGLFIDEVGKFITQNNDYFYPLAAPIIYAFFVLVVFLYLRIRQPVSDDPRVELLRALDGFMEVVDHDLDVREHAELRRSLDAVITTASDENTRQLAMTLLTFLNTTNLDLLPATPTPLEAWWAKVQAFEARYLSGRWLRLFLIVTCCGLGALALLDIATTLIFVFNPTLRNSPIFDLYAPNITAFSTPTRALWIFVRLALEGLIGSLLVLSGGLIAVRREGIGTRLAFFALLFYLTTINLLLYYFNQFAALSATAAQFIVLMAVLRYRQRFITPHTGGDTLPAINDGSHRSPPAPSGVQ